MVRIILEDIKSNKDKKPTIKKNDKVDVFETSAPKINVYEADKVNLTDSKIDEYFKTRSNRAQRIQRTPQPKTKTKIIHKSVLIIFIISVVFGGTYAIGEFFQKADVTITAKHKSIIYNDKQFVASKDSSSSGIEFEIMITSDKKAKNVILTEPKDVSIKSSGSITLYNEFSLTSQKLSSGTFLVDGSGKSYKTDSSVVIPGYKLDSNKKIIPGQITVNISAFLPGETYNGSPADFKITSFKGTPKYNKIYGKLKSPLVGGASGLVYILDDVSKTKINNIAQTSLKEDLLKKVKALVPSGYILYPDAMTFSYIIPDNIISKTPDAEVKIEGTLSVLLLKEKSLMNNIIKVSLPEIKGDELKEVSIVDLSKLIFNFTNKDQAITKDLTSVPFLLSGNIDAVWNPDSNLIKSKLLGLDKNNVMAIFRQDPGISSAIVKIFPPWQSNLPKDLAKINIILK